MYKWEPSNGLSLKLRGLIQGLTLSVLILCFTGPVLSDTVSDFVEDQTAAGIPGMEKNLPEGFHGLLGVGLFGYQKIAGSSGTDIVPLPVVLMTYRDWAYWSLAGGGVWLLQNGERSLKFGAGVKTHPGWKAENDPDLSGISERRTSIDGYVNALWKTPIVNIGAGLYHDILRISRGTSATMRLSRNFFVTDALRLTPSAGIEWQSARLVNYYYGVSPGETSSSRTAYEGRDTINISTGLGGIFRLTDRWCLLGGAYAMYLGKGITESPIVEHSIAMLVYFGASWLF